MGKALCDAFPQARLVFEEADERLGFSLSQMCFEGPESELMLTAHTQPAIVATSVAALRVVEAETGLKPDFVAGHSLGEYAALVAAGALSAGDAIHLVHLRGRFMQEAVPAGIGSMAAVMGLQADVLTNLCAEVAAETNEVVSPANFNGGGQIVIAGHSGAVAKASALAKDKGAKRAIPLKVSAPFHCALMQPAADKLAEALADVVVAPPKVPIVTNVEAQPNTDGSQVKELLIDQVTGAVRWEESVQLLSARGVSEAFEVGHGAVLAGLIRRIDSGITVKSAGNPEAIEDLKAIVEA